MTGGRTTVPAKYRAEHVGSLLRPPEVLDAQAAYAEKRMPLDELRRIEDAAILKALDLQKQAGIQVFSDGEYRRGNWAGDFPDAMDGYVEGPPPIPFEWRMPDGTERAPQEIMRDIRAVPGQGNRVIGERLRQRHRLTAHESAFLKQHAPGPYKVTMPAASYVTARGYKPGITDKAYANRGEVLQDVVKIVQTEIKALVDEGVPYIQLDNPHYPDYIPSSRLEQWRAIGIDPEKAIEDDLAADAACFEGVDPNQVVRATHICRGNGRSAWHTEGGYERIAERVFNMKNVDVFLLEYDTDRAGGFEPLRFMPKDRTVVLGLVTTKVGELEEKDDLLRRIEEASAYVPIENLAVSPQCGFASMAQGNLLSWDDQRRKLELVAETARTVWG
jgi:5-methyltetrahydropteroyltriglutamate--homocysteine methyltransferase